MDEGKCANVCKSMNLRQSLKRCKGTRVFVLEVQYCAIDGEGWRMVMCVYTQAYVHDMIAIC